MALGSATRQQCVRVPVREYRREALSSVIASHRAIGQRGSHGASEQRVPTHLPGKCVNFGAQNFLGIWDVWIDAEHVGGCECDGGGP